MVLMLASMPLFAACGDDDEDEDITIPPVTTSTQPPTTSEAAGLGFSVDSTIGELAANPCARTILAKYFGGEDKVQMAEQAVPDFTMREAQKMSDAVSLEQLEQMDAELRAIDSCEEPIEPPATTAEPTTTESAGELLTIESKMGDLLDNPDAKAILEKHLPPDIMAKAGIVRGFALPELAPQSDAVTDEMLEAIAADLEALGAYATTTAPTTAATTTKTEITGEPVKIGVLVAWSGSMGIAGLLVDQALEACDYLLEERGGILGGRPVEWVKYDTAGDIAKCQSGIQKLASDDDVLAITLGGVTPGELSAAMILTTELRIPYFTMATAMDMPEYPYTVRASVNNKVRATLCAEYILDNFDPDTAAYLAANTDSSHESVEYAKEIFQDAGVETVYEQYIPYDTTDVTPYLTAIKAKDPDVLYHYLDNGATIASMFKQITGLGGWGDIKVISMAQTVADSRGEDGTQGTYFWGNWFPGLPFEGSKAFEQVWQDVHGDIPNSLHAMLFTAIWSAVEAIDQAGVGADRDDIAKFMRSGTFGWESPGGMLVFGTDGEPSTEGVIGLVKDGEAILAP